MAAYRVVEGTQVHLDGETYGPGADLPALEPEKATQWLDAGWITKAEPVKKSRARKASN